MTQLICEAEDDNGNSCGRNMSRYQFDQDGMCSRCADLIWHSLQTGVLFVFEEFDHG